MDHGGLVMGMKRFKAEEIVNKLREADVLIAPGQTAPNAGNRSDGRVLGLDPLLNSPPAYG